MKRGVFVVCLVVTFVVLASCGKNRHQSFDITYADKGLQFDPQLEHCLIIPEGGCGGCIASGMSFVREHAHKFGKNQAKNMVIFTRVHSMKLLRRALGDVKTENLNCIIDTLSKYSTQKNEDIYPAVLYLEKGKIVNVTVQSPYSDALEGLVNDL